MAAGTWAVYARAKRAIGAGTLNLSGAFKMSLHTTAASATINALSTRVAFTSIGNEISARGGYAAGGRALPTPTWTTGASATQIRFSYASAGLVFTAAGSSLINIRYALLRNSVAAGSGLVLAYVALSTAQFTITSPNTLTISPSGDGVFTLA